MPFKNTLAGLLAALFLIGFSTPSLAILGETMPEPEQYVQVRLIADKTQVSGGETIRIGIEQTIYPKWHTYWKNPGDSGTPTEIEWQLPPNFSVSALKWPTPIKLPFGPLTNYGYENQVILLQDLKLPEDIGSSAFVLNATVNLLVCHDICIPESHDVFIVFNGDVAPEADRISQAEKLLPSPENHKARYSENDGNFIIDIKTSDTSKFQNISNLIIAPEDWGSVDNTQETAYEITPTGLRLVQKRGERALSEITTLPLVVAYQDTNGQARSFRVEAEPKPEIRANEANKSSITLVQALIFALLGGLILNLMPCVFPVLSMKALSLVNLQDKEEKKARGYGISYTAGILLSFGLIAGVLLALKAGGAQIGWGFQLQNPLIIIGLIYLVFLLGLNLSGYFEFTNRLGNIGQKLTQNNGNRGAFFTGVLATLVATPCTAPFMGAAMGFALTQPAFISMLVFLTLGLGLALPYLALCFIPALRTKLPKPGAWMETFRQLLAFPMFMTAAWLMWVLSQQVSPFNILCITLSLIAISFVIWLSKNLPTKGFGKIISLILIALTSLFVVTTTISASKTMDEAGVFMQEENANWQEFTPDALAEAIQNSDAPIFTNMTAAWCITCKVNEKVALKTDKVEKIFADKNIQYFKGDWTNQNPEITKYLNSYDRQGVPLYVYYGPRDEQSGQRPEPVVLPQILTQNLVEKTILN